MGEVGRVTVRTQEAFFGGILDCQHCAVLLHRFAQAGEWNPESGPKCKLPYGGEDCAGLRTDTRNPMEDIKFHDRDPRGGAGGVSTREGTGEGISSGNLWPLQCDLHRCRTRSKPYWAVLRSFGLKSFQGPARSALFRSGM